MSAGGVSQATRSLANRLVAFEQTAENDPNQAAGATCRVCKRLRHSLVTLTGVTGYVSLLSRALTLAKRESLPLRTVEVRPDGALEGLKDEAAEAHPILVAHILGLLATFIGEDLMKRLVHDIWPDLPDSDPISGERNNHEAGQ